MDCYDGGGGGVPTSGFSGTMNNFSSSASFVGPMIPNGVYARGAAFSGGDLSYFSGRIVKGPTLFSYDRHLSRFAKGAGLMGEAGAEAVMPLARTRYGDLGVRLVNDIKPATDYSNDFMKLVREMRESKSFGDAPNVSVNIINNSSSQVESKEMQSDGNGGFSMDVIISQVEQGLEGRMKQGKSRISQYQENAYGMNRAQVLSRAKGRI